MAKKRRERRTFSEEFKKELVQKIENGERVSDLAKEHNIQPSQISMWKRKITGKPGKRGRKPGSKNRTTAASSSKKRGRSATKSSGSGSSAGSAARSSASSSPAAPSVSSSKGGNQADVERMIGRLVLENQRLRDELDRRG